MTAKQGDFARLHVIVLEAKARALSALPLDTQDVPLEMWVKGHLLSDAEIGGPAAVKTKTGRIVEGTLVEVNPHYTHSFGAYVPELEKAGDDLVALLRGGEGA